MENEAIENFFFEMSFLDKPLVKPIVIALLKLVKSALFAILFFILLGLSNIFTFGLFRYDFIFIGVLLIQVLLILTKFESLNDVFIITIFHILGMLMEIFKTHSLIASWSYPEFSYIKLYSVPLYAGFMYASVGSTIMKAWNEFDIRLFRLPKLPFVLMLSLLVYLNFFTHHFFIDFRNILIILVIVIFWKTSIRFVVHKRELNINLSLIFLILGFSIWIGENIATFFGAWKYPNQITKWHFVSFQKIIAWSLLAIISFVIVAINKKSFKINSV